MELATVIIRGGRRPSRGYIQAHP